MAESPDWDLIFEDYFLSEVERLPEERLEELSEGNVTPLKNIVFNDLMKRNKKGNLNNYSVVTHADRMLSFAKATADGLLTEIQFERAEAQRVSESIPTLASGRKSPVRWDESEIIILEELAQSGYSTEEIAGILGKTESSVQNKLYRS